MFQAAELIENDMTNKNDFAAKMIKEFLTRQYILEDILSRNLKRS